MSAIDIPCPTCGAKAGMACFTPGSYKRRCPHARRVAWWIDRAGTLTLEQVREAEQERLQRVAEREARQVAEREARQVAGSAGIAGWWERFCNDPQLANSVSEDVRDLDRERSGR